LAKEGLLDLIIPMNYDREANPTHKQYFDQWVSFETDNKYKAQSIVGVGAYMNTPVDTAAQVRRALASQADGVCLYSYSHLNKRKEKSDERNIEEYRRVLVQIDSAPFSTTVPAPTKASSAPFSRLRFASNRPSATSPSKTSGSSSGSARRRFRRMGRGVASRSLRGIWIRMKAVGVVAVGHRWLAAAAVDQQRRKNSGPAMVGEQPVDRVH